MLKVLTLLEHYLPGYMAGGPMRSVEQIVARLGHEIAFSILTTDRDLGDDAPYPNLPANRWIEDGTAARRYMAPCDRGLVSIASVIRNRPHDVLYLNSFLAPRMSIMPMVARGLRLIPRKPVIIAPRGEFSPGALTIKPAKKAAFIRAARASGFYRDVIWQASNLMEADDIRAIFGTRRARVHLASDLAPPVPDRVPDTCTRAPGAALRVLYLSRLTPKKNLSFVLETLAGVTAPVDLTIVGPEEHADYVARCRRIAADLPPHISVNWTGAVPHQQVGEILSRHDLFFLPTWGENYGHAIFEALSAGVPTLLSDTTPWRDLAARNAGYDLPLEDMSAFRAAVEAEAALPRDVALARPAQVIAFARDHEKHGLHVAANRTLFQLAAGQGT